MNLYRGCTHGCIYCDSRSECYRIEDFDGEILVKKNAPELLRKELARKRKKGTVSFGAMSDTYIPIEKKYQLTRQCLEIIRDFRYPLFMLTKSNLVLRDLDIIDEINKNIYACVAFTITTTDDELAKIIEPNAPLPSERLEAMKTFAALGIKTGALLMPVLPFIEDDLDHIMKVVDDIHAHGGSFIYAGFGMTLRDRQRDYYYEKLDQHFPGLKEKYIKKYGKNYSATARNGYRLKNEFNRKCRELNIQTTMPSYEQENSFAQLSFDL
jgi:DNA repair photolyase